MDTRLNGKVALITGASSGIGRAIALSLATEGVHVVSADIQTNPSLMHELQKAGVRAIEIRADVSNEVDVIDMVARTLAEFGRIDLFISNAAGAWHQPLTAITTEAWFKTLNTNLSACVWGCREVSNSMISRRSGSILIVGSIAAIHPSYAQSSYSASKAALRSLCGTFAIELAPHNVRVNLLLPGHHVTGMTANLPAKTSARIRAEIPLRRFGDVDACAKAAVFLLSDELSPYTTGAELVVDGGLQLRPLKLQTENELIAMNQSGPIR